MKYAAFLCLLLAGCEDEYRKADNKVLCDPATHEAYYVRPNVGASTFLFRNATLDGLCK